MLRVTGPPAARAGRRPVPTWPGASHKRKRIGGQLSVNPRPPGYPEPGAPQASVSEPGPQYGARQEPAQQGRRGQHPQYPQYPGQLAGTEYSQGQLPKKETGKKLATVLMLVIGYATGALFMLVVPGSLAMTLEEGTGGIAYSMGAVIGVLLPPALCAVALFFTHRWRGRIKRREAGIIKLREARMTDFRP